MRVGSLLAGVDEAGRGPLAGPVVAAAVILCPARPIGGLTDSKLLEPAERAELAPVIRAQCIAWAVAWADAEEIDCLNILQATFLAMRRALFGLPVAPSRIVVDGNRLFRCDDLGFDCHVEAIVKADLTVAAVSAASILAKTVRDAQMEHLDRRYPGFDFASHKGYPTPHHRRCLNELGPTPLHRVSYAPVRLARG
ncbi:MAG TPA: ribonuclease HII [Steroidobacteraceae bacterium]|nr:ribonuclease HII [Steroidobacteraceae bacterium]HRX90023.1 ribonuclease HII [Steroidobacteraceae bacterium]